MGSDWEETSKAAKLLQQPPRQNSFDIVQHPKPTPSAPCLTKPILKRRSISQLLSLPPSPFFDHEDDIEEEEEIPEDDLEPLRPPLLHTKSDTNICWRSRPYRKDSPPRILSHEHPHSHRPAPSAPSSESSNSTGSDPELSASSSAGADGSAADVTVNGGKKKHISFNTFVEQYIAIDKPKPKRRSFVGSRRNFFHNTITYDGSVLSPVTFDFRATLITCPSSYVRCDEDSEVIAYGYDEYNQPSSFFIDERAEMVASDSDDDDDDVLEMRTSSSRSRSSSSSRSRDTHFNANTSSPRLPAPIRNRPPLVRAASTDRERVTIAPIAPTMLKTSGVEDDDDADMIGPEGNVTPVPKEVELVYVPPSNSIYSLPSTPLLGTSTMIGDGYHARDSYFGVVAAGGSSSSSMGRKSSLSAGSSPMTVNQTLVDPVPHDPTRNILASGIYSYFGDQAATAAAAVVDSPMHTDDISDRKSGGTRAHHQGTGGDAYDYFGGPDLGGDYTERRSHNGRRKRSMTDENDDDDGGGGGRSGLVRYAHGGAASVPTGRSNERSSPSSIPSVVVNDAIGSSSQSQGPTREGAKEPGEDSSPLTTSTTSRSPTELACGVIPINIQSSPIHDAMEKLGPPFMQTPKLDSPIARLGAAGIFPPSRQDSDPSFLSAPDTIPSRGRSPLCSSHSGSTTTGSYSYSSDSRSESRGRSSTRNSSSHSDPDRSGSRSSRGTSSPLGSISPTGSAVAIGGYGQPRGRDRESKFGDRRSATTTTTQHHHHHRSSSGRDDNERGRERTGRRLENSSSPPHAVGSPARTGSDMEVYQPYTPELIEERLAKQVLSTSPPLSVSGSSVSGSSTISANSSSGSNVSGSSTASEATVGPRAVGVGEVITAPVPQSLVGDLNVGSTSRSIKMVGTGNTPMKVSVTAIPIPSPIPEEDEMRSHQPTPVNSPTHGFHPMPCVLQTGVGIGSNHLHHHSMMKVPKSPVLQPVTSPSEATGLAALPVSGGSPVSLSGGGSGGSSGGGGGGFRGMDRVGHPLSYPQQQQQQQAQQQQQVQQVNGTLVGRAAEIVSSARGFLGAIWSTTGSAA